MPGLEVRWHVTPPRVRRAPTTLSRGAFASDVRREVTAGDAPSGADGDDARRAEFAVAPARRIGRGHDREAFEGGQSDV